MPYERNWYTRRVSLVGSELLLYNSVKKNNVKKMGNFQEHISHELLS